MLRLSLFCVLSFLWVGVISAQEPVLPGSEVRVEKIFDARLADARRLELNPSLPALDTSIQSQRYEVVPVDANIEYEPPRIRPLAVKVDPPPKAYDYFARIGGGFPAAALGDLSFARRNDRLALDLDLHSYHIRGNHNPHQRYGEVNGRLGGTYYTDKSLAVDLDFDYDLRQFRYYGFEESRRRLTDTLADELRKQRFGIFGIKAGIRNSEATASGIDYRVNFGGNFLRDAFATKERNFLLQGGARRGLGEIWYAEADLNIDLTSFDSDFSEQLNLYEFRPTVGAHYDRFGLRLGVIIANGNDEFSFFPNLEASFAASPTLAIVASADGALAKNNYTNLTRYNPWLVRTPELNFSNQLRFRAGVQGQFRGINYKANASYQRVENIALFLSDSLRLDQFRPLYDTANILGLTVELSAPLAEKLSGNLLVEQRFFDLETAEKPWLLPSFDLRASARYEVLTEKLYAEAILVGQNQLPYLWPEGLPTEPRTNALIDLSIHGDYRINERFGAFAQVNNLLNNRRRQFPFYPQIGINVLAGLSLRF